MKKFLNKIVLMSIFVLSIFSNSNAEDIFGIANSYFGAFSNSLIMSEGATGVILSNGTAVVSGFNKELGIGTTTGATKYPIGVIKLPDNEKIGELFLGKNTGYALTVSKKLYGWGVNVGQLAIDGDSSTTTHAFPKRSGTSSDVTEVVFSGGSIDGGTLETTTCIRESDGDVYCSGYNTYGQIGDGTTTQRWDFTVVKDNGNIDITDAEMLATAGRQKPTFCAIRDQSDEDEVWCWGYGGNGAIGDGNNTDRNKAYKVIMTDNNDLEGVVKIVGGGCGSTGEGTFLALTYDGKVYAWGANGAGQIGNGTTTDQNKAYQVFSQDISDIYISNGGPHPSSYAIFDDGKVKSWGYNGSGELGDDSSTNRSTPVYVITEEGEATSYLTNVDTIITTGGNNATSDQTACALILNGDVYCWGDNVYGQTGLGEWYKTNKTSVDVATKINVSLFDIAPIGGYDGPGAFIGESPDGNIYIWGYNNQGEIGIGDTTDLYQPYLYNMPFVEGIVVGAYVDITADITITSFVDIIAVCPSSQDITVTIGSNIISVTGLNLFIKDVCGTADDYNIIIETQGSESIDNSDSITIVSPYGSTALFSDGSDLFLKW